jgi:Zn-dependent M28 family amino/carboxypeptidase
MLATAFAAAYWYSLHLPGTPYNGTLPALATGEADIAIRLRRHVNLIASKPHNTRYYEALQQAAANIDDELTKLGYNVARQTYDAAGRTVSNLEATIEPASAALSQPSLVIGAHYDSAGDAPGANDNGTGVAALLELARLLKAAPPPRQRIRLVFFVNEEPPWFQTELMGSRKYAAMLRARGEQISGMISLETLGAFSNAPGSQQYPEPFNLLLPNVGNFIAFVAMPGSRAFMHEVIGAFRKHTKFPTVGGVAPSLVQGVDWSDHASFASLGIPALMITDTAVFRYRYYHTLQDTPDKVDYDKLARITAGLGRAVREMVR